MWPLTSLHEVTLTRISSSGVSCRDFRRFFVGLSSTESNTLCASISCLYLSTSGGGAASSSRLQYDSSLCMVLVLEIVILLQQNDAQTTPRFEEPRPSSAAGRIPADKREANTASGQCSRFLGHLASKF